MKVNTNTTYTAVRHDAGYFREWLTIQLALWIANEFISARLADRLMRFVRVAARNAGRPYEEVRDELFAEARIVAETI